MLVRKELLDSEASAITSRILQSALHHPCIQNPVGICTCASTTEEYSSQNKATYIDLQHLWPGKSFMQFTRRMCSSVNVSTSTPGDIKVLDVKLQQKTRNAALRDKVTIILRDIHGILISSVIQVVIILSGSTSSSFIVVDAGKQKIVCYLLAAFMLHFEPLLADLEPVHPRNCDLCVATIGVGHKTCSCSFTFAYNQHEGHRPVNAVRRPVDDSCSSISLGLDLEILALAFHHATTSRCFAS